MLKRIAVVLLIVSLIGSNFSRFFIYAGFELNHKYIAENLCINRDKPWLHCNGKCYFMRKIKEAQEKDQNNEAQAQKNLFQEAFIIKPATIKFHTQLLQVIPVPNNRVDLPQVHLPIFQPPQLG
jgi:hypothetical protein